MCQSVGADLRLMNEFWGQSVYTVQGEYAKERGIPCSICYQTERAVPGSVMGRQQRSAFLQRGVRL